jgi:hypothetical protein
LLDSKLDDAREISHAEQQRLARAKERAAWKVRRGSDQNEVSGLWASSVI